MSIRFRANARKALEVIVWLANRKPGIDFHGILKLMFFADVYHINEYGRPIVGDRYRAMEYGPVGLTTYELLKREPLALEAVGLEGDELPFKVVGSYRVKAVRKANTDYLSESDMEALELAFREHGPLDFNARTDRSHKHIAYINGERRGDQAMDYADFLVDGPHKSEIAADLAETGRRLVI